MRYNQDIEFAVRLRNSFRRESWGVRGELSLFRALMNSLNSSGNSAAWEIHGNRFQVQFCPNRYNPASSSYKCELGDLLIVNYSTVGGENIVRLSVLQAKVGKKYNSLRSPLTQWSLLSERPDISAVNSTVSIPKNLLSGAPLPSIASYGFFYPNEGNWEFDFIQAESLNPARRIHSISKSIRTLSCENNSAYFLRGNVLNSPFPLLDLHRSHDLSSFATALRQCIVGSPLWADDVRPSRWELTVTRWLKTVLQTVFEESQDEHEVKPGRYGVGLVQEVLGMLPEVDRYPRKVWMPQGVIVVEGTLNVIEGSD